MKAKIILLLVAVQLSFKNYAQKVELQDNFLGFGWIVGFGYDRAFFPSEKLNKIPTIGDFFKQKRKYGFRVNEEQNAYEALQQSGIARIKREDKNDTLYITPVIASFRIFKNSYISKERKEMLQVYSYKGKQDSVFYYIDMDFELQLSVIK